MDFDHSIDTIFADTLADPIRIGGTGGIKVPNGSTAERVPEDGIIRKNDTTGMLEYYNGSEWINFADNAIVEILRRNVNDMLNIDMNAADYTCTLVESQYGGFVLTNVGDGSRKFTIQDSDNNPTEYIIFIYDSNGVVFENAALSISEALLPAKVENILYFYNGGSPVAARANFPVASYQTPSTGTKISVSNEGIVTNVDNATTADINDSIDRRYVTDDEKALLEDIAGGASGLTHSQVLLRSMYVGAF